ncbi:MAG TPA: hypothetical protein VJU13_05135, partial [Candidatus Nitrosocosmicus sp.]|nr:hypothetical protein [Candidatus Nitrosocosmicus sp.]
MHIANKISPILMVFLLISFSTIYAKFTPSYGQISLVPDNSLIAQTTDCITSMMTSALIGINSDCTDNIDKINSTASAPDKSPDSTTSVSSSDKSPDSTTSVSSSDKSPDSTTSVSSSDKS